MAKELIIALSKGRILDDTLPLLEHAGITPLEDIKKSRKLIFETNVPGVKFIVIRAADVPTYVEYGVADMGIAGKDVLMEHGAHEMYEVLDLDIAKCKLMTAALKGFVEPKHGKLKVCTKFVNLTRDYYAKLGRQVEIIKLYGGQELAPILNLSDVIVDIVDTGNTLKANGLEARDFIADISSRLVVSRASMKLKQDIIQPIVDQMAEAVATR